MRNLQEVAGLKGVVIAVTPTSVRVKLTDERCSEATAGALIWIDGRNVRFGRFDPNAGGSPVNSAGNCVGVGDQVKVLNEHGGGAPGNCVEIVAKA